MDAESAGPVGAPATPPDGPGPEQSTAPRADLERGLELLEGEDGDGARAAFQRAFDSGDPEVAPVAAFYLGILAAKRGDAQGATAAYQFAIDSGHEAVARKATTNLGIALASRGEYAEAERVLRQTADLGDDEAITPLGMVLERLGRSDEAESWFRKGVEHGDTRAMTHLAGLLLRRQQAADSEDLRRLGFGTAFTPLLAARTGLVGRVRALSVDDDPARAMRAATRQGTVPPGALREAETLLRRAVAGGDASAVNDLAGVYDITGRPRRAGKRYRRAVEAGDARASTNLASMMIRRDPRAVFGRGRHAGEVRALLEGAARAGEPNAMSLMGRINKHQGRLAESERYMRQAVEKGFAVAYSHLLFLLFEMHRSAEARALIADSIARGDGRELDSLEANLSMVGWQGPLEALRRARETGEDGDLDAVVAAFAHPPADFGR